jgi:hypothetical protein
VRVGSKRFDERSDLGVERLRDLVGWTARQVVLDLGKVGGVPLCEQANGPGLARLPRNEAFLTLA